MVRFRRAAYLAALMLASGAAAQAEIIKVTCTTGMIADTVAVIGGDRLVVSGLMGPGVDPHSYKPTQSDLRRLADADVVFYNGLHLEGRMGDVLEKLGRRVRTVAVTEAIPRERLRVVEGFSDQYDPHVWFDVSLWKHVAGGIRDVLVEMDPEGSAAYRERTDTYLKQLDDAHHYALEEIAKIPQGSRVLVTAHDAFGYFGAAYGIEVVGLQGVSTAADYGLRDLERLIDLVVARGVKAVFVESSVSPRSVQALAEGARARGHEVRIGGQLYSDALGEKDSPAGTYVGMVRKNVDTIVEALR